MRSKVSVAACLTVSVISLSGIAIAGHWPGADRDGFTVHEWGTFTSVAGEDGSAVEWRVLGGKDDLPGFVNNRGFRNSKWNLAGTVRMETPVLYFYSPHEVTARVKVSFPKGLITEWYPNAEYEIEQKNASGSTYRLPANLNGIDTSMKNLTGRVEWKNIKVEPGATPALARESNPSRYYSARATDAAPVSVDGQQEKFLFYRGVGRMTVPLSARLSPDGKVLVGNCGPAVPMAIFFENRDGRLGYRVASNISGQLTLDPPVAGADFNSLSAELENQLVGQGLFRKEAQAMIATWRDSWFEEGSRLIYLVPEQTVNTVLPLQIDPVPSRITRVFVGRIELITDKTIKSVETALEMNDHCLLDRYGRFLDPILKRIADENSAAATRIQSLRASASRNVASCS